MVMPCYDDLNIGDCLPGLSLPAINRTTLALFAGASGDHNPVHIDIDHARRTGAPDVFAHGMLSMAYLGRLLTQWAQQQQLRSFGVRFTGITQLGEVLTCTGEVVEKFEAAGERRVKLMLRTANQNDEVRMLGEAVLAL